MSCLSLIPAAKFYLPVFRPLEPKAATSTFCALFTLPSNVLTYINFLFKLEHMYHMYSNEVNLLKNEVHILYICGCMKRQAVCLFMLRERLCVLVELLTTYTLRPHSVCQPWTFSSVCSLAFYISCYSIYPLVSLIMI